MVYIDSSGKVVEKRTTLLSYIFSFFSFFVLFFKSLFGLDSSSVDANANRDHLRRTNGGGGGSSWPGSGGPGGPGRNDGGGGGGGLRRQIGRLPQGSGMSCPPMAGGG